ncbi:MAG: NAD-dependent protein deacylase [Desulfurococcales archaeon]|nr:NAD-dependent protein deacylase [Desulfurococcales archaeon]
MSGEKWEDLIRPAAELLAKSRHAIALTGAGVSTASGIPDFRGPQGLWRKIPSYKFSIDYFLENPGEVWELYLQRFRAIGALKPNPSHYALAKLESESVLKAIITQNIDGLHQKAGSRNVIELHGTFKKAVCLQCGRTYPIEYALRQVEEGRLPRCEYCGGLLKPAVVMFGEPLPAVALTRAFFHAERSDVVLVAGSSLYVSPANQIPVIAKARGAKVIIVNLGEVYLDVADIKIEAPTEKALPRLCEETLRLLGKEGEGCWGPGGASGEGLQD